MVCAPAVRRRRPGRLAVAVPRRVPCNPAASQALARQPRPKWRATAGRCARTVLLVVRLLRVPVCPGLRMLLSLVRRLLRLLRLGRLRRRLRRRRVGRRRRHSLLHARRLLRQRGLHCLYVKGLRGLRRGTGHTCLARAGPGEHRNRSGHSSLQIAAGLGFVPCVTTLVRGAWGKGSRTFAGPRHAASMPCAHACPDQSCALQLKQLF